MPTTFPPPSFQKYPSLFLPTRVAAEHPLASLALSEAGDSLDREMILWARNHRIAIISNGSIITDVTVSKREKENERYFWKQCLKRLRGMHPPQPESFRVTQNFKRAWFWPEAGERGILRNAGSHAGTYQWYSERLLARKGASERKGRVFLGTIQITLLVGD